MPAVGTNVTLMWLPTGIAVAFLFRAGYRYWPAVSLGSLLVNLSVGSSLSTSLGIMLGNTFGPLVTTVLLHRLKFRPKMDRPLDIGLLVLAAHVGMLLSASNGVANLVQFENLSEGYFKAWFCWWAGDSMGVIVAVPILLILERIELDVVQQRALEFVCWLLLYVLVALGVFVWNSHTLEPAWALAFLPFPLIAWATLRFGILGASLSVLLLSICAAYGTSIPSGPFYHSEASHRILMLWLYMTTTSTLAWLIAALHAAQLRAVGINRILEGGLREASLGFLLTDQNRRITYVNEGFTRLTQYSQQELLGRDCMILQGENTDPKTIKEMNEVLNGSGYFDGAVLNYRKDGTAFWNGLMISPISNERGERIGFLGIQRDITEKREADLSLKLSEARIRRSEERHRGFIENSSTGTYLYEFDHPIPIDLPIEEQVRRLATDGFIAIANDAQARMYGFERGEQLIGVRSIDLYQTLDNEANNSFLRSIIQNGYRIVDAISEEFDRHGNQVVFSNDCLGTVENGHLVRIWGSQRDITRQHRFEIAIRRLLETTTSNELSFEEQVQRILELGCSHFRAEKGVVLRLDGEAYQPLQEWTESAPVPSASEQIPAAKSVFEADISYSATRSGVLHFESNKPQTVPYSALDTDLLMLMADWIGSQLQLRSTMSRQRALLENSPDLVMLLDHENKVEFINRNPPQVQTLAIIGTPLPDLVRPRDKEIIEKCLADVWQGRSLQQFEIQYSFDGLELNDLEGRVTPVLDGSVVIGLVVTFTDITERKWAEDELKASELRYREMFKCNPHPMWVYDLKSLRFLAVNQAAIQHYQYSRAEFLAMTIADIRPMEDVTKLMDNVSRVTNGLDQAGIWRHQTKSGQTIEVEITSHPIQYDDRPAEVVLANDVTERRRLEEQVRISQQRFQEIVERSHDLIINFDIAGNIQFVNPASREVLGYEPEEMIGRHNISFIFPEDQESKYREAESIIGTPRSEFRTEVKVQHKNGSWRILEAVGINLLDEPSLAGLVVNCRDITERKEREARATNERMLLELLTSGTPIDRVLNEVASSCDRLNPGMMCSILLLDKDGLHLHHAAAPSLPKSYSCWKEYAELAEQNGLKACWSVPMNSSEGQVLGTFAMHYSEPRSPTNVELATVERSTQLAVLAVERNQLLNSLRDSKVQLERLVGNLPGMAYRCQNDTHWTMIYVSSGCEAVTGYLRDELEQNKHLAYSDLIHSEDRDWLWSKCQLALEARVPCSNIYRIVDKAGVVRWVQERATGVYAEDGTLQFIDGFIQDISEARFAEERVRTTLREKEAMLKEIHHRVKNNLQIVSSLLNLQADKVKDLAIIDGLRDSQNRVRSMALVHETLYSGNLGRIDLSEYLHALCRHLFRSYGVDSTQIGLVLNVSNTSLDLEQAIPVGLIINELVSNSLKYAFPNGESGQVEIEFLALEEGRLSLFVSDDGVGLSESIDLKQLSSLGLQLVHDLAHQLAGSVKILRGHGTQYCITFPIHESKQKGKS